MFVDWAAFAENKTFKIGDFFQKAEISQELYSSQEPATSEQKNSTPDKPGPIFVHIHLYLSRAGFIV